MADESDPPIHDRVKPTLFSSSRSLLYIALCRLKLIKLSCCFLTLAVVAEHVQDPPAHVGLLPPACPLLQPPQLHAGSAEVPSSGCEEVAT